MSSNFADVPVAPADVILNTFLMYQASTNPNKVNLGVGAYRDNTGKPVVFSAVRKAEERLYNSPHNHEYLPIDGLVDLQVPSQKLLLGNDHPAIQEKRIASFQAISGTGALRIGGEFLKQHLPGAKYVYVTDPTWNNHPGIFNNCGFEVRNLPYWCDKTKSYNHEGFITELKKAPAQSIIVFHACAHNPTGIDPNQEQWLEIVEVVKTNKLFPFMDSAYQGFASGCMDRDAFSIRKMADAVPNLVISQSFAKNMGMYGERIGMLHIVCASKEEEAAVRSQVRLVVRRNYTSPPLYGAQIASIVLNDEGLKQEWLDELKEVSHRILNVRSALRSKLESLNVPGTWNHITDQIGMFSYTGLSREQCEKLIKEWHVFLLPSGRISLAGLNDGNLDYFAKAIASCF